MIEKMSFVTLAGPKTEIDYLVDHYLSKHDIHLENALSELSSAEQFTTFTEENPFKAMLTKSRELMLLVKNPEKATISKINVNKAQKFIDKIDEQIDDIRTEVTNLEKQLDALNQDYAVLAPFKTLNYSLKGIYDMEFFKYRFGKIPRSEFDKFESYLDPDMDEIFLTCLVESEYVYGVFFAPIDKFNEVAKDFRNIHFDEIPIPKQYKGFPNDECLNIAKNKAELDEKIKSKNAEISTVVETNRDKLVSACRRIEIAFSNFDVRKLAAVTRDSGVTFQVLCGWMTTKEAKKLLKETDDDPNVVCIVSDDVDDHKSIPPTKLKNNRFIRPFELFVKMYGLPAYNEIDPTLFLTITYAFIFGIMFGDLGQGLCLLIGGLIVYKTKKMDLAGIICAAGGFSCIFGALFGSFFGFEGTIIKPMWLSPMHAMMKLPFVGQLNTVFIVAVAFGMALILLAMVFQIINAKKRGDKENLFFSPNGVAGLVFYGFLVLTIVLYMTGHKTPGNIMMIIFLGIPVIMFLLKEPLGQLVEGKKPKAEGGVGMFLVQGFFELFETMLSFFSNTISFVRIGAFAVSHAAMMEVVLMLGGITDGAGNPNWIIIVLGNIIVCGLEGLVVGIQVLRLEYYEMFSRFYTGSGREFHPYDNHAGKEN